MRGGYAPEPPTTSTGATPQTPGTFFVSLRGILPLTPVDRERAGFARSLSPAPLRGGVCCKGSFGATYGYAICSLITPSSRLIGTHSSSLIARRRSYFAHCAGTTLHSAPHVWPIRRNSLVASLLTCYSYGPYVRHFVEGSTWGFAPRRPSAGLFFSFI